MCEIHVCWVLTWCLQCELNEVSKSECSRQEGDEIHYAIPLRKRQYNFWYCILVVFDKTSSKAYFLQSVFLAKRWPFLYYVTSVHTHLHALLFPKLNKCVLHSIALFKIRRIISLRLGQHTVVGVQWMETAWCMNASQKWSLKMNDYESQKLCTKVTLFMQESIVMMCSDISERETCLI